MFKNKITTYMWDIKLRETNETETHEYGQHFSGYQRKGGR